MKLPKNLSERIFEIATEEELDDWLREIDKVVGGISWTPVGGNDNNVHTVEVSSDPSLALVERPTNSIDALLDFMQREKGEAAPSPHEAAHRWWDIPAGGLSDMDQSKRRALADLIRITMIESGISDKPTISIQDKGTGQHPDDFADTLLSLLASNKKTSRHVMGVYNAGGAATYKFAAKTIVISRLAPGLLNGRDDEIGVTVVRYNALDPDKYKSGVYEYAVAKELTVMRLDLNELPDLPFGTYVKLIEYSLPRHARGAHEPKSSLWHLFHAALPDPALPFRIIETRVDRFPGLKGTPSRRVITGLLHLLRREGTADYSDERDIDLGSEGKVLLRYFVLNEGTDPDAYTTSDQALTITLNGQRQITKHRYWLRSKLELFYIFKRLVVLVDGTQISSAGKREMFASTRETGVDSPLAKKILARVLQELLDDENLDTLDELAKQKTLQDATRTTTEKVKRQLASQIAAYLKGEIKGTKGGGNKKKRRRKRTDRPGPGPVVDDSMMLEAPDHLRIMDDPLEIEQGLTASLRLEINGKNGFLPKYADGLSIILGPELKDHISIMSKGRLLGGNMRVSLEASADAPITSSSMRVALVVQDLGVLLTAEGKIEVKEPEKEKEKDNQSGGAPNIEISWIGRDKWDSPGFDPPWDAEMVGECHVARDGQTDDAAITKVEWVLNEAFGPYETVVTEKKLGEQAMKTFKEGYEYPVLFGLFKQRLAEEAKEKQADEEGRSYEVPDDYVKGEKARLARAVLMAMEPELIIAQASE